MKKEQEKEPKKLIRNGKVAVLVSHGFGAGWTTWNSELSPTDARVVKMVLAGKQSEITKEWCEKNLGLKDIYCGGAEDLEVEWLPEGTPFWISEYDGAEALETNESMTHVA